MSQAQKRSPKALSTAGQPKSLKLNQDLVQLVDLQQRKSQVRQVLQVPQSSIIHHSLFHPDSHRQNHQNANQERHRQEIEKLTINIIERMNTNCDFIQENSQQTMTQSKGQLHNNQQQSTHNLKQSNSDSKLTIGDEVQNWNNIQQIISIESDQVPIDRKKSITEECYDRQATIRQYKMEMDLHLKQHHTAQKKQISKIGIKDQYFFNKQDDQGILFSRIPIKKNQPLTADDPFLLDYVSRLISTTQRLVKKAGSHSRETQRKIPKLPLQNMPFNNQNQQQRRLATPQKLPFQYRLINWKQKTQHMQQGIPLKNCKAETVNYQDFQSSSIIKPKEVLLYEQPDSERSQTYFDIADIKDRMVMGYQTKLKFAKSPQRSRSVLNKMRGKSTCQIFDSEKLQLDIYSAGILSKLSNGNYESRPSTQCGDRDVDRIDLQQPILQSQNIRINVNRINKKLTSDLQEQKLVPIIMEQKIQSQSLEVNNQSPNKKTVEDEARTRFSKRMPVQMTPEQSQIIGIQSQRVSEMRNSMIFVLNKDSVGYGSQLNIFQEKHTKTQKKIDRISSYEHPLYKQLSI